VAGPALLLFALERGNAFASRAAGRTLLAITAFAAFVFVYHIASKRLDLIGCLALGWAAFLATAAGIRGVEIPLLGAWLISGLVLGLVWKTLPRSAAMRTKSKAHRWLDYDLMLRMGAAAVLVLTLTGLAGRLGPDWSGVLAPFPVATSVLVAFLHHREGPEAVSTFFRGSVTGMIGFSVFCVSLSAALTVWGVGASFAVALLSLAGVQGVLYQGWIRKKEEEVERIP